MDQRLRDGIAAAHARRLDEARALLKQAVEAVPDQPQAWFWLGVVSSSAEEAVVNLRRALALDPSYGPAREALAKLLLSQASRIAAADRPAARALVAEATVLAPTAEAVWVAAASLADDRASRLEALRRAYALVSAPSTRTRLAQALRDALLADARAQVEAGNRSGACERWSEATTVAPDNVEAWVGLAESTDNADQAQQALATAQSIAPLDPRVLAAVARANPTASTEIASLTDSGNDADPWAGFALNADPFEPPAPAVSAVVAPAPGEPPPAAVNAVEAAAPAEQRTVLVVDDSPTIRKILSLTLEREGYAVVALPDGESALGQVADVAPNVILLDIAMPGLDGYETCKRIKGDARTAHIPVLMLSGKDGMFDKVKGHMAGATEYLTKPFDAPTVVSAIAAACVSAAR